jgi:hypothetical protein
LRFIRLPSFEHRLRFRGRIEGALAETGLRNEIHVGSRSIFAAAGFTEVSHPTPRRVLMRIDF